MSEAARERFTKKNEAESLRRAFDKLDTKGDGKIDFQELQMFFQSRGYKAKKAEIEDMIWEVDEDYDRCISWVEFQAMYQRCRGDKAGIEPRRLFNIVEFIMNDKDDGGTVSMEEVMEILYLRYGSVDLDSQLEQLFGTSDINSGEELTLSEFLHGLNMSQEQQIRKKVKQKLAKEISCWKRYS